MKMMNLAAPTKPPIEIAMLVFRESFNQGCKCTMTRYYKPFNQPQKNLQIKSLLIKTLILLLKTPQ